MQIRKFSRTKRARKFKTYGNLKKKLPFFIPLLYIYLNNDNEYNYILENMDCKIANDIEECVTEKLTCSDDMDAKELAKEFIWSITDAICMIRYE